MLIRMLSSETMISNVFQAKRDEFEKEGVYIGGWALKNALMPKLLDGKHGQHSH